MQPAGNPTRSPQHRIPLINKPVTRQRYCHQPMRGWGAIISRDSNLARPRLHLPRDREKRVSKRTQYKKRDKCGEEKRCCIQCKLVRHACSKAAIQRPSGDRYDNRPRQRHKKTAQDPQRKEQNEYSQYPHGTDSKARHHLLIFFQYSSRPHSKRLAILLPSVSCPRFCFLRISTASAQPTTGEFLDAKATDRWYLNVRTQS